MSRLLNKVYDPYKVRQLLKQTDMDRKSVLVLFAQLKLYRLMQTKVADRVIKDIWTSKVDISGNFFEVSTAYSYLKFDLLPGTTDRCKNKSLFEKRNMYDEVRPHSFSYQVWF